MLLPPVLDGGQSFPCHDLHFLKPFEFLLPPNQSHSPVPADFWPPVRGTGRFIAALSPGTRSEGRETALPSRALRRYVPIVRTKFLGHS